MIDPVTKVARGVEYVREGKVHVAKATKEVILSAGAVGSPQILMLSGDKMKNFTMTSHTWKNLFKQKTFFQELDLKNTFTS